VTYKAYVVMYDTKYVRFESYSAARTVDSPLKANLYTRKRDADKRLEDHTYLDGEKLPGTKFRVQEITMKLL